MSSEKGSQAGPPVPARNPSGRSGARSGSSERTLAPRTRTAGRPPFRLLPNSLAPLPSGVRSRPPRYREPFQEPFRARGVGWPWTLPRARALGPRAPTAGCPGQCSVCPGSGGDSGIQAVAPGSACRRSCVRYGAVHTRASLQLPRLLAERLGLLLLPQKIKALGRGLIGFCCRKGSVLMKRAS